MNRGFGSMFSLGDQDKPITKNIINLISGIFCTEGHICQAASVTLSYPFSEGKWGAKGI
jgi:hypothetical protein